MQQVDTYYTPKHRDFTQVRPVSEWLRLRDSDSRYYITYKNWHHEKDGGSHHCDEYETEIGSLEQVEKIFSVLNFKKLVSVDKKREVWNFNDYEIAIDAAKNTKPPEIKDKMITFLKSLKIGEIRRNYVGYPYQFLFPREIEHFKQ